MNFLKKLFGWGGKARASEDAPLLARELEATVSEAERLVAAGRFEEATQIAENGLKRFPTAVRLRAVIQYVRRVGANKRLRAKLDEMARKRGGRVSFPRPQFCTDNGAMIAFAGALRLQAGQHGDLAVKVTPRWDMASLEAVESNEQRVTS